MSCRMFAAISSARRTPQLVAVKKLAGHDGAADSGSSEYFLIDALSVPPR